MTKTLVCLLEEPSAKEMLKGVLPRLFDGVLVRFIVFEGKQDLEKQMVRRLRFWKEPNSVFLIMRDQDAGDCKNVKQGLVNKVIESGRQKQSMVRIACHELENFYLGDLEAVEKGLGVSNLQKLRDKEKYRKPDSISDAPGLLKKITKSKYQKKSGSYAIGLHLKLDNSNRSSSFNVLISGIKKLLELDTTTSN